MPTLVVVSGLPCTGKSTLSGALADRLGYPLFTVDSIVAALWRRGLEPASSDIAAPLGGRPTVRAGYEIAAILAGEHLRRGFSVIVDAVCPQGWSRRPLQQAAADNGAGFTVIECICSDKTLHRRRTDSRVRNIAGMPEITWQAVLQRNADYEPWPQPHLVLDAVRPASELTREALACLEA